MIRLIRMARKRLMVARERIWAAWFKVIRFSNTTSPESDPAYQRKLKQFRAIERRAEK